MASQENGEQNNQYNNNRRQRTQIFLGSLSFLITGDILMTLNGVSRHHVEVKMKSLSLLTDLYEYSMANGFEQNLANDRAVFDVFFRKVPDDGSFVIVAGLQQVVEQLVQLHFNDSDISYFKSLNLFDSKFLNMLQSFEFECRINAVPEGTPIFPREPLLTIEGPLIQAQMVETLVLNILNHQSLIATKSRRINFAAQGRPVMEFGARRAQGPDSAIFGARAAVIGGCSSTSNVYAAKQFNIPAAGTMAHSWIEAFDSELESFQQWARIYPENTALLVDTYNVLESGVPNAIKVFKELKGEGHAPIGIRIDSGDIGYLTKAARKMLDDAGFYDAKITVSNALDERVITSLLQEGAPIDNFGVGEKLITSASSPVLSGVYKLAAIERNGKVIPKLKVSGSREKVTLPGIKKIYRLYKIGSAQSFADLIALNDEEIDGKPLSVIDSDPLSVGKMHVLRGYRAEELLNEINLNHFRSNDVFKIKDYCQTEIGKLPDETKRLTNPNRYTVYMTEKLANLQQRLLKKSVN